MSFSSWEFFHLHHDKLWFISSLLVASHIPCPGNHLAYYNEPPQWSHNYTNTIETSCTIDLQYYNQNYRPKLSDTLTIYYLHQKAHFPIINKYYLSPTKYWVLPLYFTQSKLMFNLVCDNNTLNSSQILPNLYIV